ncbi:MAG: hypothetical protein BroJett040_15710 [Oligoflexia bacterium]|nr:MAG: hypothetical protein BroJett040_15710 [Oligoflexia bacterium]
MKKNLSLVLSLIFISMNSFADSRQYKVEMTLTPHLQTQELSHATCSVTQTFLEADSTQVWDCAFNRGPQVQLTTQADRIGIWSGGEAYYSENLIYQGSELGQFLHQHFGLVGVWNNAFLQLIFEDDAPVARENPLFLKTEKDWYDLHLKLSY